MEHLHELFPEIKANYICFKESESISLATNIGQLLSSSIQSISDKKKYFAHLFDIVLSDEVESVINAWCVPVILEDKDVPIANKIMSFRDLLEDCFLPMNVLNDVVDHLYHSQRVPVDLLKFISSDILLSTKISEKNKNKLKEFLKIEKFD
ncbi:MAG: hypothetical protein ACFFDW_08990 [Candidatus Thorarchaeota archaeon]